MKKVTIIVPITVTLNVDDDQDISEVIGDLEFSADAMELMTYDIEDVWASSQAEIVDVR